MTLVRISLPVILALMTAGCMPAAPSPGGTIVSAAGSSVVNSRAPGGPEAALHAAGFKLASPQVIEGGALPVEYTCDGDGATLELSWSGAPSGTRSYALTMHHVASPDDIHWYWVLYDIPAEVTALSKDSHGIGTLGSNSVNGRAEYAPPCSKGPGPKAYIYTVFALSDQPQISVPPFQVSRNVLLEAIANITLASAELPVTYTRP